MQIRSLFKVVPKEGNFQPPGNLFKPALLSFYFKSLRGHISKASALWVFKKQRLPFRVVTKLILPIFDRCGEFGASIRAGPEVSREFFFNIWIYLGFNLCCCCCRSLNGLNDIERDLLQATWRNIYVYTQIFLNSNWSFLKSQFIMERNISQICPTAVFSMDVFSLRSAICSNYSFIVFGVKAWQVYNHWKIPGVYFFSFREGEWLFNFGTCVSEYGWGWLKADWTGTFRALCITLYKI